MAIQQKQHYCYTCQRQTLHQREVPISGGMGCLLTIFTMGIFLLYWLVADLFVAARPYRCQVCGAALGSKPQQPYPAVPPIPGSLSQPQQRPPPKRNLAIWVVLGLVVVFVVFGSLVKPARDNSTPAAQNVTSPGPVSSPSAQSANSIVAVTDPPKVTITKRVPLEHISASGQMDNATMTTPGATFVLSKIDGQNVVLIDPKGGFVCVATSATDYIAPTAVPAPPTPTDNPAIEADQLNQKLRDEAFNNFSRFIHENGSNLPIAKWKQDGAILEVTVSNDYFVLPYQLRLQFAQNINTIWGKLYPDGAANLYDINGNKVGGWDILSGVWVNKDN